MTASPLPAGVTMPERGWIRRFYGSVIGKKIVMAVTGIALLGFVTVHMLGNLQAFKSAAALDHYAEFLKATPALLWGTRLMVLVSLVLHVHAALTLTLLARAARPERYATLRPQASTLSARLMRVGGVVLVVFVVFHILHFTTGNVLPSLFEEGAVYANVVRSFSVGWVATFYVVAMAFLSLHLHHGVWSLFQTLGANHPHVNPGRRRLAWVLAILLPIGFVSVPLGVVLGLLR